MNGWYPKLGTWARRVLYVDTHAGRGRYESGDPGSPVLALQTLLRHSYREKLLNASEFNFLFIERDPANLAALEAELSQLKPFPARVNVETSEGDAFERLSVILNELRRDRAQMAPAFLFVDPYRFKIPAGLLGDLMKAGRVELFINVMWRELDMLVQQRPAPGTPHAQTLDEIFGSGSWRTEVIGDGMDERLDRAIPLMARGIGAKWWTSAVRMVTGGQATRYVLLHLTNSDDGRDLMKECAWSVSPAGGFMVRRSDNPDQQFLIKPEPDLRPLRDWILNRLRIALNDGRIGLASMGTPNTGSRRSGWVSRQSAWLPCLCSAALPIRDGETYLVQRGKRRPALVVRTGGTPVAKDFRAGQSRWQSAPTLLVAPFYGVEASGTRGGWGEPFVERMGRGEYPQVRVGSIADRRNVDSPLRHHLFAIGADPANYDTTPHVLSAEAIQLLDQRIAWLLYRHASP